MLSLPITIPALFLLALILIYNLLKPTYKFSAKSPPLTHVSQVPIVGALAFFTRRWEFYKEAMRGAGGGSFSFFLGKHPVVALVGDEGRKVFFESKELDADAGYAVLFGQSPPKQNEVDPNATDSKEKEVMTGSYLIRRLTRMLKPEFFNKSVPTLIKDVRSRLDDLAADPKQTTDPFETIYRIVYQLTIRTVGCNDMADDPALMEKTLQLYETIEHSANATSVLFPWFPSLGVFQRTIAGGRLYMIIKGIVDQRIKTGTRSDDPLQMLMDMGDPMPKMVEFIVGAVFTGQLNSGINAAWILVYLASSPTWLSKIRTEVIAAGIKYTPDPSLPLLDQLSHIPVEAWESEFPLIDLCLRDCIRIQLAGAGFRRNISGREIPSGTPGRVIPPGAFVTYHLADLHLNPDVYPEPEKWDPSRYEEKAEDKKRTMGYVGWGAGRHPCVGMKFAKLENNVIISHFVAMFEFELVDKEGKKTVEIPRTDFNAHTTVKPKERPTLRYRVR